MVDYEDKNGDIEKIYYTKFNKHRKFKNPKISYIFNKTLNPFLFVSVVVMMKKDELIEILKILGLINNEWVKCTSDFMLLSPNEDGKNDEENI